MKYLSTILMSVLAIGLLFGASVNASANDVSAPTNEYTCLVGAPMLILQVRAHDEETALDIAKQICFYKSRPEFQQNCYLSYSECRPQ